MQLLLQIRSEKSTSENLDPLSVKHAEGFSYDSTAAFINLPVHNNEDALYLAYFSIRAFTGLRAEQCQFCSALTYRVPSKENYRNLRAH